MYPSAASPSVFLTAADFTDFKLNTMGTYNLIASWSSTTVTSDSWTGSLSAYFDDSQSHFHMGILKVEDPLYAKTYVRWNWNEFTYVGSGTITPAATSKFNSPYFLVEP